MSTFLRSRIQGAAPSFVTLLSMVGLITACGAPAPSTPPPTTPQRSQSPQQECNPLVQLIDDLHRSPQDEAASSDDPLLGTERMRHALEQLETQSKKIDALAIQNGDVKTLARDYSTYLKGRHEQIALSVPLMERFTAAAKKAMEAKAEAQKMTSGCDKELATNKPSRTCAKKLDAATKLVVEPGLQFGEASAAVKLFLNDPEFKKNDDRLTATNDSLNERLRTVCGRPIPESEKSKQTEK